MTIAMAEVVRIDELDNIVFVYENAENYTTTNQLMKM